MNSRDPIVSPLRQRMLDDMRMRKLGAKTQTGYVRGVRRFAAFLGRSPDTATAEDLRRFQLDMVDHGASPMTINATLSALKFFFDVTLDRAEQMAKMQPVCVPTKLPVVLSPEEVSRLIAAAANVKHRTALSVAYGAGLRASEVCALKVDVAAEVLLTIAADPKHLGARIGAPLVLHTWGSALTHHPHVHGIVPGGGLAPDGTWRCPRRLNFDPGSEMV